LEIEQFAAGQAGFYDAPQPMPTGAHGDLVRVQPMTSSVEGVDWYRIMYLSESVAGEPIVVTGVVTVPVGEPPTGGWPLVTHAHGSTGIADACAPSLSLEGDRLNALEIALLSGWAPARRIAVASTDYEGLGGPGRHPFLVGESEGRSVLDAALAARQLPGVEIGPTTAIAGYSQGGHAALWANQLAPDWTPSLDIVGTMAGAPASELAELMAESRGEAADGLRVLTVGGLAAADPTLDPAEILTPAGLGVLAQLDAGCTIEPQDGAAPALLKAPLEQTEPWAGLLEENTPGAVARATPILIIHSQADLNVPIENSASLLTRLCDAGQTVERRVLAEGDHVAAAIPSYEQALDWFEALARGTAPASSCP
jgi:hypothetical protein